MACLYGSVCAEESGEMLVRGLAPARRKPMPAGVSGFSKVQRADLPNVEYPLFGKAFPFFSLAKGGMSAPCFQGGSNVSGVD